MYAGVPDRLPPYFHVVDVPIAATLEISVTILISSFNEQHVPKSEAYLLSRCWLDSGEITRTGWPSP
ncbi:hypothetical protein HZ326_5322 [Fusarium oxysporum f. sp. albedinis]|nr:hypothetical protein HZ326_5322 [Fusarium oxysporum f. sp. albedinis]